MATLFSLPKGGNAVQFLVVVLLAPCRHIEGPINAESRLLWVLGDTRGVSAPREDWTRAISSARSGSMRQAVLRLSRSNPASSAL